MGHFLFREHPFGTGFIVQGLFLFPNSKSDLGSYFSFCRKGFAGLTGGTAHDDENGMPMRGGG